MKKRESNLNKAYEYISKGVLCNSKKDCFNASYYFEDAILKLNEVTEVDDHIKELKNLSKRRNEKSYKKIWWRNGWNKRKN